MEKLFDWLVNGIIMFVSGGLFLRGMVTPRFLIAEAKINFAKKTANEAIKEAKEAKAIAGEAKAIAQKTDNNLQAVFTKVEFELGEMVQMLSNMRNEIKENSIKHDVIVGLQKSIANVDNHVVQISDLIKLKKDGI